jgi:hypothetical protein
MKENIQTFLGLLSLGRLSYLERLSKGKLLSLHTL